MKYLPTIFALAVGLMAGVAAVILGGADDSPGLQGLGALLVLGVVVLGVRAVRRGRGR